ncbi:hypothetical protein [Curtobacterium sp. VKM Ac-2922]|uniref:hypothetical protein n=1 Tax=Curtobacterium sp. VKM Ac-2922 TaxID=2929475 RepID=UPI001FB335BD|nr:hypothetical protein [Curtobacterium sp. VKM Ac-2922]MCJ1712999.1 hypothetical protein [Curtobacterium sp. VKM Ac-2922]
MSEEYTALGVDDATGDEVEAFLRRMNANYRVVPGSDHGRQMLREVGVRLEQLAAGATPKQFD